MSFDPPNVTTEVITQIPTSRAFLGIDSVNIVFPFNPETVTWNYTDNTTSMDTLGGRVIQLLSVKLNSLEITMKAGSRADLQNIATKLKEIMSYHVATQNPVRFKVPSRNWDFQVYIQSLPALGWDVATTSYPFSITLFVEEDLTGVQTKQITNAVIQNIQKDIGYNAGHHGGNAQVAYDIITTLTKPRVTTAAASGDSAATGESGVPQTGGPLKDDELMQLSAWGLSHVDKSHFSSIEEFKDQCIVAFWVARCESGGAPSNGGAAPNAGVWQMTPHNSNSFSFDELLIADNNALAMASELEDDFKLNSSSCTQHPTGSWDHAWCCYWGCFRTNGGGSASQWHSDAEKTAQSFDFTPYY